jgi:tRNA(fMet)-specific endonuclease VapC
MNGSILDTNVIIRIIKGDVAVANIVHKMKDIHIPVIVFGELIFGAEKSQLKQTNKDSYVNFCLSYPLLDVNRNVAKEYGKLKCSLQKTGDIMPENDMWIAATAIANDMQVVTQDKHFEHIKGLLVIKI